MPNIPVPCIRAPHCATLPLLEKAPLPVRTPRPWATGFLHVKASSRHLLRRRLLGLLRSRSSTLPFGLPRRGGRKIDAQERLALKAYKGNA